MAVNLSPIGNDANFTVSGVPASGYKLFTYIAGSTTKSNTFTDNTGGTPNANPIILNNQGYPASAGNVIEIWLTSGSSYKFVLAPSTDTDPPQNPVWSRDNISGVNDVTATASEWILGPTPTFISGTQFTLVGDQTSTFTVGRRVKTTNTAGTIYGVITASAFTTLTTVTVLNDSGALDSGLSAVSYGLLASVNPSEPIITDTNPLRSGSSDRTKKVSIEVDGLTTSTTRTIYAVDAPMSLGDSARAMKNVSFSWSVSGNALTCALKTEAGNDPSTVDPCEFIFRSATLGAGSVSRVLVTSALSVTIPSSGTMGTVSGQPSNIWCAPILNAGVVELAVYNSLSGTNILGFNEGSVITTTIITAPNSAQVWYSGTARTNVPFIVGACCFSTQATAGTWATNPSNTITNPQFRPGQLVQNPKNETGAVGTATAATPVDDTIPQIGEGNSALTQAITAFFAGNVCRVTFLGFVSVSGSRQIVASLFQDATANSLAATLIQLASGLQGNIELIHNVIIGTAAASTFSVRLGLDTASATITLNGVASARLFGGVANAILQIEEFQI